MEQIAAFLHWAGWVAVGVFVTTIAAGLFGFLFVFKSDPDEARPTPPAGRTKVMDVVRGHVHAATAGRFGRVSRPASRRTRQEPPGSASSK